MMSIEPVDSAPSEARKTSDAGMKENQSDKRGVFIKGPPVPSLWLFGKAQSGKSSIVRFLTGADQAIIGNGFRPETKATYRYTFPNETHPVLRFFDTRGLGEEEYDPSEDIEVLQRQANAIVVTVRINDFALGSLLGPLRQIRAARRSRPVILALTCLHHTYPQKQHPEHDPFLESELPESIPEELRRCIQEQKRTFGDLIDRIVPIDLTRPEDGFLEPNFGGGRLKDALIDALPNVLGEAIKHTDETVQQLREDFERRAHRCIHAYSAWAAGAAAVPLPWVDIPAVTGLQLRLMAKLAKVYDQSPVPATLISSAPIFGTRFLLRQGAKSLLKGVPFVGIPVNAATAYVTTFGLGRAAMWYYWERFLGRIPTSEEFSQIVKNQVESARTHWSRNSHSSTPSVRESVE